MANEQTIANLIIKLSAQTVEMAAGLKKAEGMLESFKGKAQAILGGITLTAIGYKFAKGILDAKNYAAEISKVAEKIGISTVDLSKLADVAQDVGLPLETLARGIRFLERSMLEASQAEGEHREIFRALGVEFEKSPGQVRPAIDVILDLSDAFMKMGKEDPTKAPLAMKLMGRGAAELIPLLDKGKATLTDWMQVSEKTGMVISEGLGRRAREFNRTMHNVGDAIKGISLTILGDMMPAIQSASKYLLDLAERMNKLREHSALVSESLRYMAAIAFPLAIAAIIQFASKAVIAIAASAAIQGALDSIMFARAIGGFSSLGLAIANVSYIIRHFAVAVLGPALLNPITWVLVALAGLSVAWVALGKAERDAQRDQEKFADSVRTMKMGDLQMELRDTERLLSLMQQKYAALKAELEEEVEVDLFSAGKAKQADDLGKAIDRTKERVDILNKAISESGEKKVGISIADPEAMKALQSRVIQLKAAMAEFIDPVAKARAENKAFIEQTVKGKGDIKLYEKAIADVTAANERYIAASQDLKIRQARVAGNLANEIAVWDAYLEELETDYEQGLLGIENYYAERIRVIEEKTQAEIDALKAKRELPGIGEPEKVAIDLEIEVKETGLEAALAKEKAAAKKAIDEMNATLRAGELQEFIDRNSIDLEILINQYETGLVDLATFFRKRREMIQAEAEAEIANIQVRIDEGGLSLKEKAAAEQEIAGIRTRAILDQIRLNKEMTTENRNQVLEAIDLTKMLATVRAEGAVSEVDAMKFRHDAELAELDRRNLEEINQLAIHLGQKSEMEMSFNEKRQAMENLYAAQDMRRRETLAAQERAVAEKRLQAQLFVVGEMGKIFGTLYEMGGKKLKAFFFLQKAMAIAEIYIQTAVAATKALGQMGIFGIPMSTLIWGMGLANIAIVVAQTIQGFVKGGPVTSGSGRKDDVPAMLTRGEFVQPEPIVRYYGVEVMEAIRRRLVPREILQGFGFFAPARPQFAYATGGEATRQTTNIEGSSISIPITINAPATERLVEKLHDGVRNVVIRIMKEETRD